MAVCDLCQLEMTNDDVSCVATPVLTDTGVFQPVAFGRERIRGWKSERCGDCGVRPGGFHHRGCDMEECPRCFGQLISCGCDESELTADDMVDDDGFDPLDDELDRQLHTDVFLRVADAAPVLAHLRALSPSSTHELLDLMATNTSPGRVVRFCVIQAEAAVFDPGRGVGPPADSTLAPRPDFSWRQREKRRLLMVHERAVGGADELATLDVTNPLVDRPIDWSRIAPQNRATVEATLAHLDRVFAAERVPLELAAACRRFLAFIAQSPKRPLRTGANGARVAAGIVWAVFLANNQLGRRSGWSVGTLWHLFGVTPSARNIGVALRRSANLSSTGEEIEYDERSLGRPEFYTLDSRQQIAALAADIRSWPENQAS